MTPDNDGIGAPERPYDPDDITTWDARQLDELAVWALAAEQGAVVVDEAPEVSHAVHAHNFPGDHDFTAGDEYDPYLTDRR